VTSDYDIIAPMVSTTLSLDPTSVALVNAPRSRSIASLEVSICG
jgi:hypothetical protein